MDRFLAFTWNFGLIAGSHCPRHDSTQRQSCVASRGVGTESATVCGSLKTFKIIISFTPPFDADTAQLDR